MWKIFQNLRSKQLFFRILILLLGMVCLMFALMSSFLQVSLSRSYQQQRRTSAGQLLATADAYIDLALLDLGRSMQQLLWDTEVTGAVLVPDRVTYDRRVEIVKLLATFEQDHPLVERAYLLTYADGMACGSDGETVALKDAVIRDYLTQFSATAQEGTLHDGDFYTSVVTTDGQVALLQAFPTPEQPGALLATIDKEELFAFLAGGIDGATDQIQILDRSGGTILRLGDPAQTTAAPLAQTTAETGWQMRLWQDPSTLRLGSADTLRLIGLWAAVFGTISALAAVAITLSIYRPIRRLRAAVGDAGAGGAGEDELATVQRVYQTELEQRRTLTQEVQAMAPIVRERLYKGLLRGERYQERYLEDRLAYLHSPLEMEEDYFVLVCALQDPQDGDADEEMGLLYQRLRDADRLDGAPRYEHVLMDDYSLVLIVPARGQEELQGRADRQALVRQIEELRRRMGGEALLIGCGRACHGIRELDRSYEQARQQLHYLRYHGELAQVPERGPEVREILERAMGGDQGQAELALRGLLDVEAGRAEPRCQCYTDIMNDMVELLIGLNATPQELSCFEGFYQRAQHCPPKELEELAWEAGRRGLALLAHYGQRSKNRYIAQAKKYIEEHFADSQLSLDRVAEYVGIHSTYLSRLFYEVSDVNFVNFVNHCRVEKAKTLLRQSSIPVMEVGFKTGFNSQQSFSRVFKRHTGQTPGTYRREGGSGT